jgi:signal transduction histidine kinase
LLGVVGAGLVASANQLQDRAVLAARRDAQDLALALRACLQQPGILALVPAERRLRGEGGYLVVDPEVGWLEPTAAQIAEAVVHAQLRTAAAAEFVQRDPATAAARFDALLAQLGLFGDPGDQAADAGERSRSSTTTPWRVLAAAAWQAVRAGHPERSRALTERLATLVIALPPAAVAEPSVADAVAALALLCAAHHEPLPPPLTPQLAALPEAVARPLFARLAERGQPSPAVAAAWQQVAARRDRLRRAAVVLAELPLQPVQRADGDELLLWFPGTAGAGDGAYVTAAWLAALPGLGHSRPTEHPALPPVPDGGRVVVATTAPPDADVVVAGFAYVVPHAPPPLPWSSQPTTVLGAGALLAMVFALSATALLAAQRREALAVRARSDFLTGVTHELKTPLAAIRLVADVLQDDEVEPSRQRDYFGLLAAESARLSTLLDNVLDLGRMERGERAYDLRAGDLAQVVRDTVATFQPLAQRAGLVVTLDEGATELPTVLDHGAMVQALLNVLENARKYAAAGGRLILTTAAVAEPDGTRWATVTVRDFGPGVPVGEQQRIFGQFQRGDAHAHGSVPGVGLGLFLARAILHHHGGTLACTTPADGTGANFVFTLPLLLP